MQRPRILKQHGIRAAIVPLLLFLLSFSVRNVRLGSFSWPDEVTWTARSIAFYAGLTQGDLQATHQSDHPGVVPMWGYGGILSLRAWLRGELGELYTMTTERKLRDVADLLAAEALWTVLFTSLTVVGIYLLLNRVLNRHVSLIAALLVALDPFYLTHSRVVHLDAILTSLMTLSALALAVYLVHPERRRYLFLSSLLGGLAFATKSPALVLAPLTVGGLGLRLILEPQQPAHRRIRWAALSFLVWLALAWLTFLTVWPAAWLAPLHLTSLVVLGSRWGVTASHHFNYFLGKVTETPGPLFYLVVGPLRMSPLTFLLILPTVLLLVIDLGRAWRRKRLTGRTVVLVMATALVIGFGMGISLAAKKGDRYLLPVFPMLDILAALSLQAALGWLGKRVAFLASRRRQLAAAVLLVLAMALSWLPLAPYYGAYFNPLLGNGKTAVWAFPFGQGEGLDLAAEYLNEKPDAEQLIVASFYPEEFDIYFDGMTISLRRGEWSKTWQFSDYVVFYISQVQRQLPDAELVTFFTAQEPEYTARIGGIEFAWVYRPPVLLSARPPSVSAETQILFGDKIVLRGYSLGSETLPAGAPWEVTLHWQAVRPPEANYHVRARLVDTDNETVWQTEWAPFDDKFPTGLWPVGRTELDRQSWTLPHTLEPGQVYCLEVQLFDSGGSGSLPVAGERDPWGRVTCLSAGD